jgi:hypothetical protein
MISDVELEDVPTRGSARVRAKGLGIWSSDVLR